MRSLDDLVSEAADADVTGWDFAWLDGRATEQRPPWGYAHLAGERLGKVRSALDIDTGGGEVLAMAPVFPTRMVATESWSPNVRRAHELLGPRGVEIVETGEGAPLPFPEKSFELAISRHPVRPDWEEIHRVLRPGGVYLAQHVGPASAYELIERFVTPTPESHAARDPKRERAAAKAAGLVVTRLRTTSCRMAFYDVGAIVWILRKCVWWVPDFSVEKYHGILAELDAQMRRGEPVVAHSTRHLIQAYRPELE